MIDVYLFVAVEFITARLWRQPLWPSTDEWVKKSGIYTQVNEYYSCHKEKLESLVEK